MADRDYFGVWKICKLVDRWQSKNVSIELFAREHSHFKRTLHEQ